MQRARNTIDPLLREQIETASTLWQLACDLLRFWRKSGMSVAPNEDDDDWRYEVWANVVERTQDQFGDPRMADEIHPADRHALIVLANAATCVPDAVHAMAWGLCSVVDYTFAPAWRDELGGSAAVLKRGAFYPVADALWALPAGLAVSPRPASLSSPISGELPSIRVHDGSFDVTVDTSLERSLEAISVGLTHAAGGHPNLHWTEMSATNNRGQAFPVRPADPAQQRARLTDLVNRAQAAEVVMAVLPELCVSADDIESLAPLVQSFGAPQLVVAGSHHVMVDNKPENVAVGLLAGTKKRMRQVKNAPFTSETSPRRPLKEGIRRRSRVELNVYQADRYRYAITICRDLLDERVRKAYDRMGVNVLLVPALSPKTQPFRNAVAARVASAQALTIVVNGPLNGPTGSPIEPAIVVGQPVDGHTVSAPPVAGGIGLTVFELPFIEDD
jgi:predicted amidohydrolase